MGCPLGGLTFGRLGWTGLVGFSHPRQLGLPCCVNDWFTAFTSKITAHENLPVSMLVRIELLSFLDLVAVRFLVDPPCGPLRILGTVDFLALPLFLRPAFFAALT